MLADDAFRAVVAEAARAPSVHNTQPVRWRRAGTGIALRLDPARRLPVGDPAGRDALVSLGAALEGAAIALCRRGHEVGEPRFEADGAVLPVRPDGALPAAVAMAERLSALMDERRTHRGPFRPARPATLDRLRTWAEGAGDVALQTDPPAVARLLALGDEAALAALRDRAYRRELLGWMRLSSRRPGAARDGLAAAALGLGPLEARGARFVLGPLFASLDRLGLARRLLAERGAARHLAGVAVLHRPDGEHSAETGRIWLRRLLALAEMGMQAWPLGVLTDTASARAAVAGEARVPTGRAVAGVFRVGLPAPGTVPPRARLPAEAVIDAG